MSSRDVVERLKKRKVTAEVVTDEGTLHVRGLNGRERAKYFDWLSGDERNGSILLSDHRLLALVLCEQDGSPIFPEDEAGQKAGLEAVQEWTHEDVSAAAKKALSLSGIGKSSEDDAAKK